MVPIGVIGAGWWATQHHIPAIRAHPEAELVALADPNPQRLRMAADRFEIANVYADYRELLRLPGLAGVIIAVPHSLHYQIARDALEARLHVLVEKPMVLRGADARALVALADQNRLHLLVGYTFQYTAHAALARSILRSGKIGELRLVAGVFASVVESYLRGRPDDYSEDFGFAVTGPDPATYSDPGLSGGGQAQTQVTHLMGMAMWTTGQRATDVFALMGRFDLAVDLVDAISYRLEGGALGSVAATGSLRPDQPLRQALTYYGSAGFVVQDLAGGRLSVHLNSGPADAIPDLPAGDIYPAGAPAKALCDLILGRGENRSPGSTAADVVEFLESAYRSASSGRLERVGA